MNFEETQAFHLEQIANIHKYQEKNKIFITATIITDQQAVVSIYNFFLLPHFS